MSLRENPVILRQSFNKLWTNNIYLSEGSDNQLQFTSLLKSGLMLSNLFTYKYTKMVSQRAIGGENDLDYYVNLYKYRKNDSTVKKKLQVQGKRSTQESKFDSKSDSKSDNRSLRQKRKKQVKRVNKFKWRLPGRFEKMNMYQQVAQEFADVYLHLTQLLFRLREPVRRLPFFRESRILSWMRESMRSISRQPFFKNTVNVVILMHFYKTAGLFSQHFGRELEKVRKKVHWKLVSSFKRLISTVPTHPEVGRHFYGMVMEVAGRPRGQSRTVVFRLRQGSIASQTYRFRVTMGTGIARAKVGLFGIRTKVAY